MGGGMRELWGILGGVALCGGENRYWAAGCTIIQGIMDMVEIYSDTNSLEKRWLFYSNIFQYKGQAPFMSYS